MLTDVEKLRNDELRHFAKTESSIWDYYEMLRKYTNYENSGEIVPKIISYENMNSQNLINIREQMKLSVLKEGDDEIKCLGYLKNYAYDMLCFKGKSLNKKVYDNLYASEIIDDARKKGYALNCRYISYIFCQMLLSVGFKARLVWCLSPDLYNNECHCITEVYIYALRKWVVVDAQFCAFYFGEKGKLLNLYEMRNMYISGKMPIIIGNKSEEIRDLQLYWIKNIFRFRFITYNGSGALKGEQKYWGLNPKGFKMKNRIFLNGIMG